VSTGVTLPAVVVVPVPAQAIAFTGVDSQRMLGLAAILIGLGGLLLIAARRRRRQGLA
jgi:LPXTG-motif cell wall-anchored protein